MVQEEVHFPFFFRKEEGWLYIERRRSREDAKGEREHVAPIPRAQRDDIANLGGLHGGATHIWALCHTPTSRNESPRCA